MDISMPHGLSLDPTAPAFPFGYGLDYLDVSLVNASVSLNVGQAWSSATRRLDDAPITVHVKLHNAAGRGAPCAVRTHTRDPSGAGWCCVLN